MQTQDNYTFGDHDRAAERLYWLARTFDPETLSYVKRAVSRPPRCCVDLGAGPGFLTRSLHAGLQPQRTVGLEASARFVEFGRRELPAGVELVQHDITTPLPTTSDLMVSRFLLTHLSDPLAALRVWRRSEPLLLVLEELVGMSAELPVLTRYYELVAQVQQAAGQDMHIGTRLPQLARDAGFAIEGSSVQRIDFPVPTMTRLHALNLPTLRQQPVVAMSWSAQELDEMQRQLETLAASSTRECVHVDMARCRAVIA